MLALSEQIRRPPLVQPRSNFCLPWEGAEQEGEGQQPRMVFPFLVHGGRFQGCVNCCRRGAAGTMDLRVVGVFPPCAHHCPFALLSLVSWPDCAHGADWMRAAAAVCRDLLQQGLDGASAGLHTTWLPPPLRSSRCPPSSVLKKFQKVNKHVTRWGSVDTGYRYILRLSKSL